VAWLEARWREGPLPWLGRRAGPRGAAAPPDRAADGPPALL
jgi:hypothetical protein